MDELRLAEDIGRAILLKQNEHFMKDELDNLEHIAIIKVIIGGITDCLRKNDFSEKDVNAISQSLKQFSKDLFIESWMTSIEEGEDLDEARTEGEDYFDYIFEHEKYPH
jgi:hypothetical protein